MLDVIRAIGNIVFPVIGGAFFGVIINIAGFFVLELLEEIYPDFAKDKFKILGLIFPFSWLALGLIFTVMLVFESWLMFSGAAIAIFFLNKPH